MQSRIHCYFKASTVDDDNWERFFVTVLPARLKVLSLEALEAGMLKIPIASLLRAGNCDAICADGQNFTGLNPFLASTNV